MPAISLRLPPPAICRHSQPNTALYSTIQKGQFLATSHAWHRYGILLQMVWHGLSLCVYCSRPHTHTHTHTHPFNGPLSGTIQVSRYLKGKTNLDFTEAKDSEWHWHQLGHMQVYTSFQADNHAGTPPLSFYRPDALPATQPTASKHCRH